MDIKDLKDKLEAATALPWVSHGEHICGKSDNPKKPHKDVGTIWSPADRELIIAAVNALPELLKEVEAKHEQEELLSMLSFGESIPVSSWCERTIYWNGVNIGHTIDTGSEEEAHLSICLESFVEYKEPFNITKETIDSIPTIVSVLESQGLCIYDGACDIGPCTEEEYNTCWNEVYGKEER